jgi:hypothetical protein
VALVMSAWANGAAASKTAMQELKESARIANLIVYLTNIEFFGGRYPVRNGAFGWP